jgi:hypothetical protein
MLEKETLIFTGVGPLFKCKLLDSIERNSYSSNNHVLLKIRTDLRDDLREITCDKIYSDSLQSFL